MRAVVQWVRHARVLVDGEPVGAIAGGLLLYVGVAAGDTPDEAAWLAQKVAALRIFAGDDRALDRSLLQTGGAALVVSQLTLLADTRRGRRPSFTVAAPPEQAEPLVEAVAAALREQGIAGASGR